MQPVVESATAPAAPRAAVAGSHAGVVASASGTAFAAAAEPAGPCHCRRSQA